MCREKGSSVGSTASLIACRRGSGNASVRGASGSGEIDYSGSGTQAREPNAHSEPNDQTRFGLGPGKEPAGRPAGIGGGSGGAATEIPAETEEVFRGS